MTIVLRWFDRAEAREMYHRDGDWVDVKEGMSEAHGVHSERPGHTLRWVAIPTPFVETRDDGVKAQVWAVRPR